MYARHLVPQNRCTFIGEDEETDVIVRCGKWLGHAGEHVGKPNILQQMSEAIAATMGYEHPHTRKHTLEDYIVIKETVEWYKRLVVE